MVKFKGIAENLRSEPKKQFGNFLQRNIYG